MSRLTCAPTMQNCLFLSSEASSTFMTYFSHNPNMHVYMPTPVHKTKPGTSKVVHMYRPEPVVEYVYKSVQYADMFIKTKNSEGGKNNFIYHCQNWNGRGDRRNKFRIRRRKSIRGLKNYLSKSCTREVRYSQGNNRWWYGSACPVCKPAGPMQGWWL